MSDRRLPKVRVANGPRTIGRRSPRRQRPDWIVELNTYQYLHCVQLGLRTGLVITLDMPCWIA